MPSRNRPKYVQQRVQLEPISRQQSVANHIADMAVQIDAARLLTWKAASMKDHGQNYSTVSAMAKMKAGECVSWVTNKAVQVHGGYGYIKEYDVERFFRDGRICEIYEGTTEIQKLVVSRAVLG